MDVYQRRRLVALSVIAAVFIIFVLLIRSCGGDDEPNPLTTAVGASGASGAAGVGPLSQSAFISQADEICLQANTAIAEAESSGDEQAPTDIAEALAGELDSLQTLPEPEEGADDLDRFLSAVQDQVNAYDDRQTAAERGDDAALAEIDATIDAAASKAERTADGFGFDVCGDLSQTGDSSGETSGDSDADADPDTDTGTADETAPPAATTTPVPTTPSTEAPPVPTTPTTPSDTGGGATPTEPPATDAGTEDDSGGIGP